MIYKTSILSLVLMPFLLCSTSREELQEQIKAKESELWQMELLVKQEEEYYQELCDKLLTICKSVIEKLTEKEREQILKDVSKFDADLYNLVLSGEISEPKFIGQRDGNQFAYKQWKFLIARVTIYSQKLSGRLDNYGKCAQKLFMLYEQLNSLPDEMA